MTRTNIYDREDGTLLGWYDPQTSVEAISEARDWDGNNHVGRLSGGQAGYEMLFRTKGGRWVRYYNFTREYNGPEFSEFLTPEQARDWLLRNGSDEIAERYFGELEEESGPGRPAIGDPINIRLGVELQDRVDANKRPGETRAAAIRRLLEEALANPAQVGQS